MKTIKTETRTYYRSLYAGGQLWCESRDPEEVIRMSTGDNTPEGGIEKYTKTDVITTEKISRPKKWIP